MEYRRRSLWNRVWENESLDVLGKEEHVRRIYDGESRPWKEIVYGVVLSVWKGVQWMVGAHRRYDPVVHKGDERDDEGDV